MQYRKAIREGQKQNTIRYTNDLHEALLAKNGPTFLPRCMQCRRGLAMRILSVRPSVRHTRELWQNRKKIGPDLYPIWKNI